MKKYQTEFKLEVVKSFLAGEGGAKLLARRWSLPEEKIRSWVSHYRLHGIDGLRHKHSAYSAQFKLQVLSHQDREQLSSRQVAAVYDIRNPNQVVVWRRKLDEDGVEALGSRKQGRFSADKARLITALRRHHKLVDLLQVAGLARSTFYYQCQAIMRNEQQSDIEVKIRTIYDEHKGRYGYRRITAALCSSMAQPVNHKCVQRLMQKMGLRALIRAKKRFRHVPSMSDVNVPNVLQRDFVAEAPNQKWVTDVTEFNVHGQKLYLSACMDLYNGEIIAYRMARRPVFDLVPDTLREALARSACTSELIVHSDQGWHYKMQTCRAMLAHHGVNRA